MDAEDVVNINLFGIGENILGVKWTARMPILRFEIVLIRTNY
jgi:hypothetical protein